MKTKKTYINFSVNENGELEHFEIQGNASLLISLFCLGYDRIKDFKEIIEMSLEHYEQNKDIVDKLKKELN